MTIRLRQLLFLTLIIFLMACANEKKSNPGVESQKTAIKDTSDTTYITISSDDNMQYDITEIRGQVSKKINLTLKHIGTMPKNIMGHNVVILKQGVDVIDFATKAASAMDNDYIPLNSDETIAYTKMLGGGEETTIEFTVDEPGTYNFLCSFPAHYRLMKGKLIIKN